MDQDSARVGAGSPGLGGWYVGGWYAGGATAATPLLGTSELGYTKGLLLMGGATWGNTGVTIGAWR